MLNSEHLEHKTWK